MRAGELEDWGLPMTLVFALAFTVTLNQSHAVREAKADTSFEQSPRFVMTITAKRLPPACKGTVADANAVYCAALIDADPVVEMHETATRYAERVGAVDVELAYSK